MTERFKKIKFKREEIKRQNKEIKLLQEEVEELEDLNFNYHLQI